MEPKWLYRLESTDPKRGLWYDASGNLVWTIGEIPNCPTKDLPMDYDWRYRQDGRMWHSSCTRKEDLAHWYTLEAALDLIQNHGFVFAKYLATEYKEYDLETVFIKETCLEREELDIRDVFGKDTKSMLEELDPELFIYELYDSSGPMMDTWDIAKYCIGWCDASRLQVRPRSDMIAIMLELPDGERIWFHWEPKALKAIERTKARIENYEKSYKEDKEW